MKSIFFFIALLFPATGFSQIKSPEQDKDWVYLREMANKVEIAEQCLINYATLSLMTEYEGKKAFLPLEKLHERSAVFEKSRDTDSRILGKEAEEYVQKYHDTQNKGADEYRTFVWNYIGSSREEAKKSLYESDEQKKCEDFYAMAVL